MTNRIEELYKIYENLTKEMELKLIKENDQIEYNDSEEFACTINNPISIKTKGRNSKRIKGFNDKVRKCGICNSKGHNIYTCLSLAESYNSEDNSEKNDLEDNSEENNLEEINIKYKSINNLNFISMSKLLDW
ncbi:7985_t:CDS:2 [Racocetra fulgida]|uniref:7985_t:CDS:1 n=1 Tax=Racocetra fulgida TaxID=60492 RepID=A0A9N9A6G8_9GLOM|nr:7985_t:CDS:2 [Racocetra fulgida]